MTLLLALNISAFSADIQPKSGRRIALVMGNDAYTHISKLERAGNDAYAMARELRAAGFQVLLQRDLNYRSMVKAVETLSGSIAGGDQVVVFFAGHGVQLRTGSYLLPVDIEGSSESEIEKTAYSLNDLTEKLSEAKAAFTLVLVDACRDNPIKSNGRSVGSSRGLSAIEPPKGQMVVYSASKGQQALDKLNNRDTNPNGVFTREFIAHMRKPGMRIEDLVREVQDSVETLALSVSYAQRPAIYNESRGNFYFYGPVTVHTAPASASVGIGRPRTAEEIEDNYWDSIKDSQNTAVFEEYFKSYLNGRYASLARLRQQELREEAKRKQISSQSVSITEPNLGGRRIKVAGIFSVPFEQQWAGRLHQALKAAEARGDLEYKASENVSNADYERVMREYATAGSVLIVGEAFAVEAAARKVAKDFPKVSFLMGSSGKPQAPNFSVFDNYIQEPAYLSGMIAGGVTKSNKIGMVGGFPIPEVNRLMNAFMAGAKEVNPKVEFSVSFINSWFDPPKAKQAAFAMIDKGADVMYAECFGVSDAAKEKGKLAIGNVINTQDKYPDTVVASALWHMEPSIDRAIKLVKDSKFTAEDYGQYSMMKHKGSSLAPLGTFEKKVPAEIVAKVKTRENAIVDGKFEVKIDDIQPRSNSK